ncbi:AAHS family benzoate transporter-like MFS transporter/SHS family lactate transporter-like MFS transporter [Paraburkholderia sp. BL27I4N3]|uniref:MFS transporter n=1 Tax=Paraburkholderia sp. BL27I4N3 TaxID=1938805 RepID=UPI000E246771|nr:MFS transporter [Paraburkholderia sp. BL27I4N3]REE07394.1 AAHS family benzoate transporter-like MFS transporter/SHS family lactate transporter-like MFS transporter [Paraburkholderia sp. BL27I4N3]
MSELDKAAIKGGPEGPRAQATLIGTADERMSPMARRVLIFVFLAWVIDAADSTIYSLTLPQIRDEFGLSFTQMGLIASVFIAGSVLGAFILPAFAEKKGRRAGMAACIGIFSLFTGIVGVAHHAAVVAVGRFCTGLGTGAEWPIGAAYLSEMVPAKKRGLAMGIMQAGYPVGFFLAGGIFALFTSLGLGWRACYVVLVIPALMCIPVLKWLKESPAWLANRAARLDSAHADRSAKKSRFRELFAPEYRRFTLIATALHIFGAIFSYGLVVWVPSAIMLDFHIDKMQTAQFVMLAWGVGTFGYLAAGPLADRFGRKIILTLYTILGMIAILYLNYLHRLGGASLTSLYVPGILIGISLGVAAVYITYTSEIFPSHLRTIGLGFSVGVGKVTALAVPTALGAIAQHSSVTTALLLSTAIGFLMIPVVYCGPETARRKLEDIVR